MDARRYVCVCVHALLFPSSIRVPWFVLASKRILPLSDNAAALCWQRTGDGRARSYIGRGARRLLQLAAGDCAGHRRQRLREPAYSPGGQARWPLVCRRRCVLCNVATRLVVYLAGSRRDPRVLRLARWSSRHRTRLYAPPAVPLLLERRCRVGRARQVAAAAEQRRPMEPRRSDLAAERSSPAVSASTVSSCEPERRTQLSFRRWRYRGRVRLFHGNAPQLFRLKAALEQLLLRGFLLFYVSLMTSSVNSGRVL